MDAPNSPTLPRTRLIQQDSQLQGTLGTYTYGNTGWTPEMAPVKNPDRVKTYVDPNGVLATYSYDERGNLQKIDIDQGPSYHYTYDGRNWGQAPTPSTY